MFHLRFVSCGDLVVIMFITKVIYLRANIKVIEATSLHSSFIPMQLAATRDEKRSKIDTI